MYVLTDTGMYRKYYILAVMRGMRALYVYVCTYVCMYVFIVQY